MKKFIRISLFSLLSISGLNAQENKPNILFIFVDDFSPHMLTKPSEERVLQTPNIDKLALNGTVFDNACIMGSYAGAVCLASRTGLNSGFSLWKAANVSKDKEIIKGQQKEGLMWSQLLKKAGYNTYMTGKWHVNFVDPSKVFDKAEKVRGGMPKGLQSDMPDAYNRPLANKEDTWKAGDTNGGGYWQGGTHWTQENAECAINYIQNYKSDKPFFMYVAFNAPHDPRQSPQEYLDMYPVDKMPVPKNFKGLYEYREAAMLVNLRDEDLAPYPRTEFAIQTHTREYFAIITHLDKYIGDILNTLKERHLDENTIIIFAADNGLAMGEHGLLGKQNMYSHSSKVPLIILGKDIQKNKHIKEAVYLQDLFPTTLDLVNAKIPEFIEYKSFLPLLKDDKAKSRYDSIYSAYQDMKKTDKCVQQSLLKDNYRLIYYTSIDKYLLFNLKDDPHEMYDLSNDKKYAKIMEEMKEELKNKHKYYKAKGA